VFGTDPLLWIYTHNMCDFLDLIDFIKMLMYSVRVDMPMVAKAFYFTVKLSIPLSTLTVLYLLMFAAQLHWLLSSPTLQNEGIIFVGYLFRSFTILVVSSSKSWLISFTMEEVSLGPLHYFQFPLHRGWTSHHGQKKFKKVRQNYTNRPLI
jgi:hypothetical protein